MSISLINLTKSFGDTTVVDDLSLEIGNGEFVVFLGPSGCGKTTTLRMVAGLEQPSAGDIRIDAERVNDVPPQRRDIAMVFQSYALYPHLTVAENIAYPLRVRKLAGAEIKKQVSETAALLELETLLARRPRDLSGGERQRVALARAIVRHPRAFLMDEPLSNLDAKLRLQMRGELKRLQQTLGTTTVYVTHDQAEAMTLGHRVAVMNKGKLQQFDTPLEIYERPANRFVAEFVGSPGMNLIDGRIDLSQQAFLSDGLSVGLTEELLNRTAGQSACSFGVRPEHVRVTTIQSDHWTPVKVYVTELMGSETFVILETGSQKIIARTPGSFRADSGRSAWISFDLSKVHLFDALSGERMR
jgi:multiple sugar transport system ATP-binding protein